MATGAHGLKKEARRRSLCFVNRRLHLLCSWVILLARVGTYFVAGGEVTSSLLVVGGFDGVVDCTDLFVVVVLALT